MLSEPARRVVEAAGWFPGRRDDFAVGLGVDPDPGDGGVLPDWLINLVLDLGRAGLGEQAVTGAHALSDVDPGLQAMLDSDVAVALAESGVAESGVVESGLVEQARARVASNLARCPDDVWIRVHAGDAPAALDNLDEAAPTSAPRRAWPSRPTT